MGKLEYTYRPVSEIFCFDRRRPPLARIDEFPWLNVSHLVQLPKLSSRSCRLRAIGFEMTRCPSCRKDRTTPPRLPTLLYYVDNAIVVGLRHPGDPAAHAQRLDIGRTVGSRRRISIVSDRDRSANDGRTDHGSFNSIWLRDNNLYL
jgi:hypothetical protein